MKLERGFYTRDVNTVARELLGKILVRQTPEGICRARIVETEAYSGVCDMASHSYPMRRSSRTEIQFGQGGFAYVYMLYGIHFCFNVVANGVNVPEAVLIRALEPVDGIELMKMRRGVDDVRQLTNGPGKLCKAMEIAKAQYGTDLCGGELYIEDDGTDAFETVVTTRINIDYAKEDKDLPWRYYIKGNPFVSKL